MYGFGLYNHDLQDHRNCDFGVRVAKKDPHLSIESGWQETTIGEEEPLSDRLPPLAEVADRKTFRRGHLLPVVKDIRGVGLLWLRKSWLLRHEMDVTCGELFNTPALVAEQVE